MSKQTLPQANDLSKVIRLTRAISTFGTFMEKANSCLYSNIFNTYRQQTYYMQAAQFIGWIEKSTSSMNDNPCFRVSQLGEDMLNSTDVRTIRGHLMQCKYIGGFLSLESFDNSDYVKYLLVANWDLSPKLSRSTLDRRVLTVKAWIKWLSDNKGLDWNKIMGVEPKRDKKIESLMNWD